MTNYNDGRWHGWNGEECPVHPKTRIEGLEPKGVFWTASAGDCHFESFRGAFRVIREHREPREWWIYDTEVFDSEVDASDTASYDGDKPGSVIHVREVIDE